MVFFTLWVLTEAVRQVCWMSRGSGKSLGEFTNENLLKSQLVNFLEKLPLWPPQRAENFYLLRPLRHHLLIRYLFLINLRGASLC